MNEAELFAAYKPKRLSEAEAIILEEEAILDMADRQTGWVKCRFCITQIALTAKRDVCRFCFRSMQEQDAKAKAR